MIKEFFINAYLSPPPKMKENGFDGGLMEKGYRYLSEAGFTHCLGFYEQYGKDNEEVKRAASLADKYGISYLVYDKDFCGKNQDYDNFVKHLKELQEIPYAGHFLFDEPGRKQLKLLKEMLDFYKSNTENKFPYINLQPLDSPANYLKYGMWTKEKNVSMSYGEYMEEFFKTVVPSYLSYDFYPFSSNKPIKEGYFEQLEIISALSKQYKIPFYSYIQACSWENRVRIPTFEEVLWQCGMSICYGAKGLQYFCFFTPYSNGENRRNVAMLDFDCNPTDRYIAAKTFNLFLKKIEKQLFLSEHIKILNGEYGIVNRIAGDCVAGYYHGETDGIFITNKHFDKATEITINFDGVYDCCLYGLNEDIKFNGEKITVNLWAGESVFLSAVRRDI
jgi:hypothetical protein